MYRPGGCMTAGFFLHKGSKRGNTYRQEGCAVKVREVMQSPVICVEPGQTVVEHGAVRGIVSIDDLAATEQNAYDAADALGEISAYFLQNKC